MKFFKKKEKVEAAQTQVGCHCAGCAFECPGRKAAYEAEAKKATAAKKAKK